MPVSHSDGDIFGMEHIELPNGRLVCRPHGLVVCGYCCVDFSFMDEILEEEEEEEQEEAEREDNELYELLNNQSNNMILGPGRPDRDGYLCGDGPRRVQEGKEYVFPTKFTPPSATPPSTTSTPAELFPVAIGRRATPHVTRFIRRDDPDQALIYADGACRNNGQANARAGWAFVFNSATCRPSGVVSGRLEKKGPFGDQHPQTSNRAELRAVVAALRFRHWTGEGFRTLVFATDSEYVAEGATTWVRGWASNGWTTSTGAPVKNKDLWEALLGEFERWDYWGLKIQFWRIPRRLNSVADRAAKQAATEQSQDQYVEYMGALT
ncbi:hypothetical protein CDD83_1985 [Cordyceps sp. RAO-2017]|nr:hypothetical protein CDD83_1985 [Cordyceps sp. RAO-2017]